MNHAFLIAFEHTTIHTKDFKSLEIISILLKDVINLRKKLLYYYNCFSNNKHIIHSKYNATNKKT